ncbi:MAG TPA: hypothetical protein VKU41_13055 [Polyangiaceae bacterium]|nr:hypothetical protein [Polyangiaceae bacterium]
MTQPVVSGQLITAVFMNGILTRLSNLEAAVAALKGAVVVSTGPHIISIAGLTSPIHEGDPVSITGTNFGFSTGSQSLSFNGISVASFASGSSDSVLFVRVPVVGAQPSGTPVTVVEGNGNGFDSQGITVYPAVSPVANNEIQVVWSSVSPNPVQPGQAATVSYTLTSKAAQTSTFAISATITPVNATPSSPAWPTTYQVLDGNNNLIANNQFTLDPNAQTSFAIRFNVPAGSDHEQFQLRVNASSGAAVNGATTPLSVTDSTNVPDPSIGIAIGLPSFTNTLGVPDSTVGSYNATTSTIAVKAGCTATLSMNATFQKAGTYKCALVLASGSATGWTANPLPAQEIIQATEVGGSTPAARTPTANFVPTVTSGNATYNYTITNTAGPATGRSVPINVTVMS